VVNWGVHSLLRENKKMRGRNTMHRSQIFSSFFFLFFFFVLILSTFSCFRCFAAAAYAKEDVEEDKVKSSDLEEKWGTDVSYFSHSSLFSFLSFLSSFSLFLLSLPSLPPPSLPPPSLQQNEYSKTIILKHSLQVELLWHLDLRPPPPRQVSDESGGAV
jgi:hypothetical protein